MHRLIIERLKTARNNKGLKQADVAEMLGVKKNTISNWENDKADPDIDSLIKLCSIYGISCSQLLDEAYENIPIQEFFLSDIERHIILAYRHSDNITKELVYRALSIDTSRTRPEIKSQPSDLPIEDPIEPTQHTASDIDAAVADYRHQLELEARQAARSAVSPITDIRKDA